MPVIGSMIADSARLALAYSDRLLKDVPDEAFARFARVDGSMIESNHPAFILGHLSLYPGRIVDDLGGDASAVKPTVDYMKLFSKDARCIDDPDGSFYPPPGELRTKFQAAHQAALDLLEKTDDAVFAEENPNEAMRGKFRTKGSMHAFYMGGHLMTHMGQLSAWRRAMGLGAA